MTSIAATAPVESHRLESPHRIISVTRLHFVNKFGVVYFPLIILVGVLLVNLAIWIIIRSVATAPESSYQTGAIAYIYVYSIIVGVQAISRTFPFSLGFGVTRRDYYLGSVIAFVMLSVIYTVALTILNLLEGVTNGWFVNGRMFTPLYLNAGSWGLQSLFYFVLLLVSFLASAGVATFWVRWKTVGLVGFFAVLAILLIGGIALLTYTKNWAAFGNWFGTTGLVGIASWLLVPAVAIAIAGFFILRRATPKS